MKENAIKVGKENPQRKYKEVSIHFTPKNQDLEQIKGALDKMLGERTENGTIAHHCFMPRKKVVRLELDESLCDMLDDLASKHGLTLKCWNNNAFGDINGCRGKMLDEIKGKNGLCLFVGDIREGVATEFEMCKKKKCNFAIASIFDPQASPIPDPSKYPDWFKKLEGVICHR